MRDQSDEKTGAVREGNYVAAPPGVLRIVPLDELTLIYHRASGQTHVVAPPVPEILAVLAEAAMTPSMLLATLAECYDLADPDIGSLAGHLDELAATGLVMRE